MIHNLNIIVYNPTSHLSARNIIFLYGLASGLNIYRVNYYDGWVGLAAVYTGPWRSGIETWLRSRLFRSPSVVSSNLGGNLH